MPSPARPLDRVPSARIPRVARALAALALALGAAGCGDGTSGPAQPDPLDVTTPGGIVLAMEEYYSRRLADEMIGLLADDYRFVPLEPDSIPFLPPGAVSWDRATEEQILREILVPERSVWLDQVLLEVEVEDVDSTTTADGTVITLTSARTKLIFVPTVFELERSSSRMHYELVRRENGDLALREERELARSTDDVIVSELKARAYAEIDPAP